MTTTDAAREALARLEQAATVVSRYGAATGPQWPKLSSALIQARAVLSALPAPREPEGVAGLREALSATANALHNAATELHHKGSLTAEDYEKQAVAAFAALAAQPERSADTTPSAQPEALVRLLRERDGQEFDGQVSLSSDEAAQIITALSTPPPASGDRGRAELPADVARLVIAARLVQEGASWDSLHELDQATEAFASRVPWNDDRAAPALAQTAGAQDGGA